jgi:hypothetical protein
MIKARAPVIPESSLRIPQSPHEPLSAAYYAVEQLRTQQFSKEEEELIGRLAEICNTTLSDYTGKSQKRGWMLPDDKKRIQPRESFRTYLSQSSHLVVVAVEFATVAVHVAVFASEFSALVTRSRIIAVSQVTV